MPINVLKKKDKVSLVIFAFILSTGVIISSRMFVISQWSFSRPLKTLEDIISISIVSIIFSALMLYIIAVISGITYQAYGKLSALKLDSQEYPRDNYQTLIRLITSFVVFVVVMDKQLHFLTPLSNLIVGLLSGLQTGNGD